MDKQTAIQIVLNSMEELQKEVGNDHEYNGCSHLVKIIISKIKDQYE
tara:strand:+ start:5021 stop:5161 length:141 start_codon:yes stop_codon:yes gene_type:complete